MNVLLIILIILAVWRGIRGFKLGLVDETGRLLALVISLFVISLGILLYTSIQNSDTKNMVLSIVMIIVTGLVARLVKLIIKSLSAIAHLPIISALNSLLGIAIGVSEAVVALWIVYVVIASFDTGTFGHQIMEWTSQSEILQKMYDMNQFAYWMAAGL
ncbi:MAG: CvpA family protein [Eubacteriales bacterium]|nr:CvpA family protein [Eubacteriales bacterium]